MVMKITISKTCAVSLKDLFWHTFFASRKRGVSLSRHFPWIDKEDEDLIVVEGKVGNVTVGGLVVRTFKCEIDENELSVGMVGLVCVSASERGKGYASALLQAAINTARNDRVDLLTLWTSQHHIYQSKGFYLSDPWLYGSVTNQNFDSNHKEGNTDVPFAADVSLPLPPFASSARLYVADHCTFTVLEGPSGLIVAGYDGDVRSAAQLMIKSLPRHWYLNSHKDDELSTLLINNGMQLSLSPANLQMWLPLREFGSVDSTISKIPLRYLDRI
jgi:GNAT superfamily N-acetyltransferase